MREIVIWAAGLLGIAAGIAIAVVGEAVGSTHGRIAPHEQMRERTPWPPPPQVVRATYEKREPLALPRGDR